jgi:hypothetical protein
VAGASADSVAPCKRSSKAEQRPKSCCATSLEVHRDRCIAAVRRTPVLDGVILPTGALLGAACVSYSLGVLPVGVHDWTKLVIELAVPGAGWLAVRLAQTMSGVGSGTDSATAIDGGPHRALLCRIKQQLHEVLRLTLALRAPNPELTPFVETGRTDSP